MVTKESVIRLGILALAIGAGLAVLPSRDPSAGLLITRRFAPLLVPFVGLAFWLIDGRGVARSFGWWGIVLVAMLGVDTLHGTPLVVAFLAGIVGITGAAICVERAAVAIVAGFRRAELSAVALTSAIPAVPIGWLIAWRLTAYQMFVGGRAPFPGESYPPSIGLTMYGPDLVVAAAAIVGVWAAILGLRLLARTVDGPVRSPALR